MVVLDTVYVPGPTAAAVFDLGMAFLDTLDFDQDVPRAEVRRFAVYYPGPTESP
jgi:hypothetical protein